MDVRSMSYLAKLRNLAVLDLNANTLPTGSTIKVMINLKYLRKLYLGSIRVLMKRQPMGKESSRKRRIKQAGPG